MKELSMHILDLVQNSITAKASEIIINVIEQHRQDKMIIEIIDNGKGIPKEIINDVTNPFVTDRTTRKVGLGIPLMKAAAERCDGKFEIESQENKGTIVRAYFKLNHIDRAPLGDIVETLIILVVSNPDIDFVYKYRINNNEFIFDTKIIKEHIKGVSISNIEILNWIRDYIKQGIMGVSN